MKRLLTYIILILTAFLLQSSVFCFLALADIVPNLLMILTASIALIRGRTEGCLMGFFCGLLLDITTGTYLGVNAICFLTIGYLLGYFNQIYYEEDLTIPVLMIGAADLLYGISIYLLTFFIRGRFHFLYYLRRIILPELVFTVILAVFVYRLILFISRKLEKKGSGDFIV